VSDFTPGPWTFRPFSWRVKDVNHAEPHMKVIIGHGEQGLAYTVGLNNATDLANARLIAAAPDLLEACELARDFMNDVGATKEHLAVEKVFKALAKAEGR